MTCIFVTRLNEVVSPPELSFIYIRETEHHRMSKEDDESLMTSLGI